MINVFYNISIYQYINVYIGLKIIKKLIKFETIIRGLLMGCNRLADVIFQFCLRISVHYIFSCIYGEDNIFLCIKLGSLARFSVD